ncbi:MAG: MJ0042-type zinc finger domain-containing protein, partial [Planctomycetales bacterium]
MPIDVRCPSCDKAYKVKDDAAGKKFRCKNCETAIVVPELVLEADPWDAVDEQEAEEPQTPLPPRTRRKRPAAAPTPRRSSRGGGMPATIIVAIITNVLLIPVGLLDLVGNAISLNILGSTFALARIGIEGAIIKGLYDQSNRTRWTAIVLDILGLLCGSLVLIGLAATTQLPVRIPA